MTQTAPLSAINCLCHPRSSKVFNLTSLICLYIPRASFVCNFVASISYCENSGWHPAKKRLASVHCLQVLPPAILCLSLGHGVEAADFCKRKLACYHSITLWKFLALIRDFFGGSERMLQELAGKRVSPNPFPCCCCCCLPEIAANRANLRCMTVAVYQLSLIRTILFFITLILWTDDEYDYGAVGYTNPNSYINVIIAISTFLSFYGYLLFYKATKPALEGYNLRYKFVCIILVLVLCGLQSGIVETMGALGAIPCSPSLSPVTRSQMIYYYALAIEMFFIGIFAHYSFRRIEPSMEAEQVIHHQASQTQEGPSGRCSPADGVSMEGTNPGYLCDEAFCTIEHSPLDRFDFIVKEPVNRQQPSWGLGCQRGGALKAEGLTLSLQQPGTEVSGEIQIQSHVNKMEANGASAV
ncbi:organic solute transporter subunit alpha-like isoform X3 [Ahaetulla prasina]|uniref:organic solute transporter subunit alpha-like isoform X3 n=1 Tax=Ahaetulla prasina TaxID=499056 RepID=UPI0026477A60|nr:organic solute transporter subunit alpha-like isoform X3 [Ahaetulla prasina]